MKITREELNERLSWPLDKKIGHFIRTFVEFFFEYQGGVYLSFSGGKDSQVGSDIIDRLWDGRFKHYLPDPIWEYLVTFPKPKKVFSNTGLEFPEIVEHVKGFDNVEVIKPRMGFTRVITEIGVAVGSKKIALTIERLRKYLQNPSDKNEATRNLYLYGIKRDGTRSKSSKLPDQWKPMLDAPFKISDKCCDILKKEPFQRYSRATGKKPVVFTTVVESSRRTVSYMQTGCNSFEKGKEKCRPLSIFTNEDIWEYHDVFGLRFCEVYYDRTVPVTQIDGSIKVEHLCAETRTGCLFCCFGVHLEDKSKNNRIQRLAISHPKYWDIVVNKCGLSKVLRYIGVPYEPNTDCNGQQRIF